MLFVLTLRPTFLVFLGETCASHYDFPKEKRLSSGNILPPPPLGVIIYCMFILWTCQWDIFITHLILYIALLNVKFRFMEKQSKVKISKKRTNPSYNWLSARCMRASLLSSSSYKMEFSLYVKKA